jgi:mono/diheme cytochrome c family protein
VLETGGKLYAANCAACHGENGAGDGVMASALAGDPLLASDSLVEFGHTTTAPADFTDASRMLGANAALLQGKIIRGGMGTGMPYWGPIFTEEQTWAIVDYLWTFQFDVRRKERR